MIKKCIICGKEFKADYPSKKYCSSECFIKDCKSKSIVIKKCEWCGKEFYAFPSNIKVGNDKFCSQECSLVYLQRHQKQSNTPIELKMKEVLEKRGIFFEHQKRIDLGRFKTYPDFYIEDRTGKSKGIVIYCDGDFFHGNPEVFKDKKLPRWVIEQRKRDKKITHKLIQLRYKVIRFYEKEIEENIDKCVDRIIQCI